MSHPRARLVKRLLTHLRLGFLSAAAIALAIAVPTAAEASHKPGHQGGPVPPKEPSLKATPSVLVLGGSTVLSGRLEGANNGGETVTLQGAPHPFTTFNNNVATTLTDSDGYYRFTRRPGLHTRYRVNRVSIGGALSPAVTVLVRQRVSLHVSDRTPKRGQLVRFSGRSCPEHDGGVVSIQKRTSTGGFVTVHRTRLREASRCSVYSRRLRIYRDGAFRVVVSSDADHARGFSRLRSLDAHR